MIAFDLGLVDSGAAWDGGSDSYRCPAKFQPAGKKPALRPDLEQRRLSWWRSTYRLLIREHADGVVWREAPIIHPNHPNGAIPLIQLHGVLLLAAYDEGATVYDESNQKMKSWAHKLEGIATTWPMDKDDMLDVAQHLGCDTEDHNEADAFILWTMKS